MNLEVYARIKDFDNYAVSNFGNVINIKTGRKLKPATINGYLRVILSGKKHLIHRLVACQYLQKIENKNLVDHIDGCKTNNYLNNLRFCNASENMRNSKPSSKNTSGVKGLTYDKKRNKWQAQIMFNNCSRS